MNSLYHIYIKPKAGVTTEQVEAKLNLGKDWYRYDSRCYVVFTNTDQDKWFERLDPLVGSGGTLFICKFQPNSFHGWMDKSFWKWFAEKKKEIGN